MIYIGQTSRRLNERINNHRSDINKYIKQYNKQLNEQHKKPVKLQETTETLHYRIHPFNASTIDILKFIPDETQRTRIESQFMFEMASLYPYGLNDRFDKFNIKESLNSSCIFSLFSLRKSYEYRKKVRSNLRGTNKKWFTFDSFFKLINFPLDQQFDYELKDFISIVKNTANKFLFKFLQRIDKHKFFSIRIKHIFSDLIKFKLGLFQNPAPPLSTRSYKSFLVLPFTRYFPLFDLRKCMFSPELKKSFPSDFLSYPKLTYKLDLPFSKLAFNYREFCSSLPDLSNSVELESIPCFCNQSEFSTFINPHFGHVVTGDLGIVSDDILRRCFSYGTKYRPIFHISKIHYYNKLCYFLRQYIIKYSQMYGVPLNAFSEWFVKFKIMIMDMLDYSHSHHSIYKYKDIKASLALLQNKFIITTVDKASNNYSFICKRLYADRLWNELNSNTFELVNIPQNQLINNAIKFSYRYWINVLPSFLKLPFFFGIPKFHKNPIKFRFITSSVATAFKDIAVMINSCLDQLYNHIIANADIHNLILSNSKHVIDSIKDVHIQSVISYDFTTLYTNIKLDLLLDSISSLISKFWPLDCKFKYNNRFFSKDDILIILKFSLNNNYVKAGDIIFKQIIGIPMGASYSVNLANLFLFYYENSYLSTVDNSIQFKYSFRYIDDLLAVNNSIISDVINDMYPPSLALELTNAPPFTSVDYLDLNISIGSDNLPVFKLFDKRSLYSFQILGFPHISSNIPDFISFNTYTGQIYRFFNLCYNNPVDFIKNTKLLSQKFMNNGFSKSCLIRLLHRLKFKVPPIRPLIHAFFESEQIRYKLDPDISID